MGTCPLEDSSPLVCRPARLGKPLVHVCAQGSPVRLSLAAFDKQQVEVVGLDILETCGHAAAPVG